MLEKQKQESPKRAQTQWHSSFFIDKWSTFLEAIFKSDLKFPYYMVILFLYVPPQFYLSMPPYTQYIYLHFATFEI